MQLIFLDEAGYSLDWKKAIEEQPFYVLSAVCIPADTYAQGCNELRDAVQKMNLPEQTTPLGRGFEIKARDIAQGSGYWKTHEKERNEIRDLMLSFPNKYGGVAFVVVVDKAAHFEKYVSPKDPSLLALQYIFERLQMFLQGYNDIGYCIYDENERLKPLLRQHANELMTEGSHGVYYDQVWQEIFQFALPIKNIVELNFGSSRHSIGLEVADYFASLAYHYYKNGKPALCGWWDLLVQALHRKGDKLMGVGLKEFPEN